MWTYLAGPILALLPSRWRLPLSANEKILWPRAAWISGILEAFACLSALIGWYFYAMQHWIGQMVFDAMQAHPNVAVDEKLIGYLGMSIFLTSPLTWALAYFSLEGVVRGCGGYITGESFGTLPLVLIDRLLLFARRRRDDSRVPLVADQVVRPAGKEEGDLQIRSCRSKPAWKYPLTVRFEGESYQVIGERKLESRYARPFTYFLRRLGTGEIVRGVEDYDANHIVQQEGGAGIFGIVWRELRSRYRIRRLPLVADETRTIADRNGLLLEIRSCRPKPEWTVTRLVQYQGEFFRIEAIQEAGGARPFVFRLRRLPAGVPSRSVLQYSPEEVLSGRG